MIIWSLCQAKQVSAYGAYPLQFNVPNSYVKLSEREMEVIHLTINTPDEGIYDLSIGVKSTFDH